MAMTVPGVVELNPLVSAFGLWPAKLIVFGFIVLLARRTRRAERLWVVCGGYAVIVASNVLLFLRR